MNKDIDHYLKSIYFKISHPAASFSRLDKLYKFVKKDAKFKLSKWQLKKWLTRHNSNGLRKPVIKNNNKTNRIPPPGLPANTFGIVKKRKKKVKSKYP